MSETFVSPEWLRSWQEGWTDALLVFGLRNCTVTNDGHDVIRVPIGRRDGYIDLAPGETVSIRAVRAGVSDGLGEAAPAE